MKIKLLTHACLFLLFVAYLTSCKKEEVKPVVEETALSTSQAPKSITVSYKIYASSGNFKLTYTTPNTAGNQLESNTVTINKLQHDIEFVWKTGNRFKVQASNVNASNKEVTVEVYINGILYNSGIANSPNAVAAAEAMVY